MLLSPLLLSSCTALSALAAKSYRTQPDPPSWIDRLPQRNYTLILSDGTTTASCNLQPGAVLINGTSPGPTLRARRGERLLITVHNALHDRNATIHWHGLSAALNSASDGTPLLSQWPIKHGHSFQYSIRLPRTWETVGSYFYHSHVDLGSMSAFGPLIIEDDLASLDPATPPPDLNARKGAFYSHISPYHYSEDRVLILSDFWGATTQKKIAKGLRSAPFVWPGSAQVLTVNGKQGMNTCNQTALSLLDPTLQCIAGDECANDFAMIRVPFDARIRLRIIGAQTLMYTTMGIFNHSAQAGNLMQLIEADGSYLNPLAIDTVELATGQRYSWLIHTKTQEQVARDGLNGIYWIRLESRWRAGPAGWARLVYPTVANDADIALPAPPFYPKDNTTAATTRLLPNETFGWITSSLSPLKKCTEPFPADRVVTRTVIIDQQQIGFPMAGQNASGVRWAENAPLAVKTMGVYNEDGSQASFPSPLLVDLLKDQAFAQGILDRTGNSSTQSDNNTLCTLIDCNLPGERERARKHRLNQGYDPVSGVYVGHPGEVIDIIMINKPSALSNNTEIHPWHMHASKHWTVGIWPGTFSFEAYDAKLAAAKKDLAPYAKPIPRDTTILYSGPGAAYLNETVTYLNETVTDPSRNDGGWAVLRYRVGAINAGAYPLHCHIAYHLVMGMAVVWALGIEDLVTAMASGPGALQSPESAARWREVLGVGPNGTVQGLDSQYLTFGGDVTAV